MRDDRTAALKPGAVERLLETEYVSPATRRALKTRLADNGEDASPLCFDADAFATLAAVCDRLIPQGEERRVNLAAHLDRRLADGPGDGWRYDVMPPDRAAFVRGVAGLEAQARALFADRFVSLTPGHQDTVLNTVQDGSASGGIWTDLPAKRFFEELLAQITEIYYSHPFAQERIGYVGMADVKGFHALGLNARDPVEQEASLAPL